ncbi:hypothetical protein EYF80_015368 [Liparis tanakae]|uniref:Uncharacterized protein n=1 Tax=Liparis tanakae TaxID=230148 RepID=A0A4Z2I8M0_9TELE|nr:hypothetical protein EYF80_015368 [Liparis tanakae]
MDFLRPKGRMETHLTLADPFLYGGPLASKTSSRDSSVLSEQKAVRVPWEEKAISNPQSLRLKISQSSLSKSWSPPPPDFLSHVDSPSVCPASTRPFSPTTAPRACLSPAYWMKAYPLCTEQPRTRPYLEKMPSTSDFFTTAVFRLPMNTRELMDLGSVLLVTLLVWTFSDMLDGRGRRGSGWRGRDSWRGEDLEGTQDHRFFASDTHLRLITAQKEIDKPAGRNTSR